MALGANMARFLKSMLHGRNCAMPLFSINGNCPVRLLCMKSDESQSDASEQKSQKSFPTNVDESKQTTKDDGTEFLSKREEKLKTAKPYTAIPEMPTVPIFGSAHNHFPIIGEYSSKETYEGDFKKAKRFGDMLKERFGTFEVVNCYHQEGNEVVLRNEGKYPSRGDFFTLKAYRQKRKDLYQPLGLVAMDGEEWHNFRKEVGKSVYVVPDLNRDALVKIAKEFVELIRAKRDANNEVPDLMELLCRFSLESVCVISIDARLGCLHPDIAEMGSSAEDGLAMIKAVQTILECINKLEPACGNFPFWQYLPTTPTWAKFMKASDVFTELVFKYVKVTSSKSHLRSKEVQKTLLEKMLFEEKMAQHAVAVAVSDIMMAGIDTTSHAIGYFLYNLAKNPDKQELLYEEILKQFPGGEKTSITRIPYFDCCMWESMRLLPVIRGHMRILKRDAVLCGYKIPTGTSVLSVQQVFTRDARFFENPDKYIPERYQDKSLVNRANPFGIGKRSCAGQRIATLEIFAAVVEVLRNFRIEYNHEDIKQVSRLVNIPDRPIRMKFYDR